MWRKFKVNNILYYISDKGKIINASTNPPKYVYPIRDFNNDLYYITGRPQTYLELMNKYFYKK